MKRYFRLMALSLRGAGLSTLALLVAAGCGGAAPPADGPDDEAGANAPLGAEGAEPVPGSELLETPAGEQLLWTLEVMGSVQAAAAAPVEEHFTAEFLEAVPPAQLRSALLQVAVGAPLELRSVTSPDAHRLQAVVVDANGTTLQVRLSVEPEAPHRIAGFGAQLADYLRSDLPASWPALEAALREEADTAALFAAHLGDDGECTPIYDAQADLPLAVGSAFKLWVLGALAEAVAAGDARWDEPLPLDPAWRSISDAILRDLEDGHPLTLQEHAAAMISVSDNSATDHLIHRLGRDRVEAAMVSMGAATPERNIPFLTTRAFFALKLVWSEARRAEYLAADDAAQRTMLEEADAVDLGMVLWASLGWSEPWEIDRIEFFASTRDLCHAMAALREMGETETGGPVMDVLSQSSGIGFDDAAWAWVGFKGGSEVGVLNGTWLLRRADGEWFVLVVTVNDTEAPVDTLRVMRSAAAGFNLLAEE